MILTFEAVEVDRAALSVALEQLIPESKWPANRSRRGRGRSYGLSLIIFMGHLIGTTAIYGTLIAVAWSLGLFYEWLNGIHPFSDDISKLVSRVELGLAYADTALCACFWLEGTWVFFKETRR